MYKYKFIIALLSLVLITAGCKKQLDIGNPNQPSLSESVTSLDALISLAQGGVYINGFKNGDDWLGDSYFCLPRGYHELIGDELYGGTGSNNMTTLIGVPDSLIFSSSYVLANASPQISLIRTYNTRSATAQGNNVLYYEWLNMYALNNAMNVVLTQMDNISSLSDDAVNTLKAWCYWWKGYAYAAIGTMYYSGLIADTTDASTGYYTTVYSGNYVLQDSVIGRSNYYFGLASSILSSMTESDDYDYVLEALIPAASQTGLGYAPTPAMWVRNINTMLARNILLNKLAPFVNNEIGTVGSISPIQTSTVTAMTSSDWNKVLAYATDGIEDGDYVFTGRTTGTNDWFSSTGGSTAAYSVLQNTQSGFKVSERWAQNIDTTNDQRYANNVNATTSSLAGYSFNTRYSIVDGGNGVSGVFTFGSRTTGDYELYIAGSYEENALMLAEANIWLGNTDAGLAYVDAVRNYQGAGLTAVSGTGLTASEALLEVVKERQVALVFRGLSFFDIRRWGWSYSRTNGGGRYGATLVTTDGTAYTDGIINYNYLDYWDVPADESDLNPATGSVATKNPNF
ncbi:RagB/SusD family nutrient uptake outer membrane protein [Parafilimonas sp.]|uniref:RagB/SusD family nutrient uptake outer membrane protein n=1 Tax=Parafilimonas sp. TaxID=1969739 RepID=UPI0039E39CDB